MKLVGKETTELSSDKWWMLLEIRHNRMSGWSTDPIGCGTARCGA